MLISSQNNLYLSQREREMDHKYSPYDSLTGRKGERQLDQMLKTAKYIPLILKADEFHFLTQFT